MAVARKPPKPKAKSSSSGPTWGVLVIAAAISLGFLLSTPSGQAWKQKISVWAIDAYSQAEAHARATVASWRTTAPAAANQTTQETVSATSETAARRSLNGGSSEMAACRLSGQVVDCGCDFASVERLNHQVLNPVLTELVHLPFYKFFKVNLYCDCQFWPDAGMCVQRDCCVAECEPHDIPEAWRQHDKALAAAKATQAASCDGDAGVDRSVSEEVHDVLAEVPGWHGLNNPWVPDDDKDVDYVYVDLTRNVEKYTGYKGEDARRIWSSIYEQEAISEAAKTVAAAGGGSPGDAGSGSVSREQQVLYRLISGMHASITMSIVQNGYDEATGTWGPNLPFFKARFTSPAARPYVENLYFTLLFVLRAVTQAADAMSHLDYTSGWSLEDGLRTRELVRALTRSPDLTAACPVPFDEGLLWRHSPEHTKQLTQQLRVTFHNITRLMDCVGCEKCKMHGKLNILGIATALKVLFYQPHLDTGKPQDQPPLKLDRNEAIALVNFLAKLSDSVESVRALSLIVNEEQQAAEQAKLASASS